MYSRINNDESSVGGLILAAGLSTRMGQSKPLTKCLDKKLIGVMSYSESLFVFPHPVKLITSANADMIIMLLCFIDFSIFCLLPSY